MTAKTLVALEHAKAAYGEGCSALKLVLLRHFEHRPLRTARAVARLHDILCFLRAYPDDALVLAQVNRMLANFHRRPDLVRHRRALADTGIAGTRIHYRFFWSSATWLARRWPGEFQLDRSDTEPAARINAALPCLVTPAEAAWLKEAALPAYRALDRLRSPTEADAGFLVRRIAAMPGDDRTHEAFYDAMDVACVLRPAPDTPTRTHACYPVGAVYFRTTPLRRTRPDLREQIALAPRSTQELSPREAGRALDLARGVMVTRARDLDAFAYGDIRDVRHVDDGNGLQFLVNGIIPARRPLVSSLYGYLILQNGTPIGYGDLIFAGRSVAVAFNTFETFRGGEAAWTFARVLAMVRHVFGTASFMLEPYQLGHYNEEGIASGAWWFYQKLGFMPRSSQARALLRQEIARMRADPGHRSERAVLRTLASSPLFFDRHGAPDIAAPTLISSVGQRIARYFAQRGGSDRERAARECAKEAAALLGLRSMEGFTADERMAWQRWAPLTVQLHGLAKWSAAEKRELVHVIRAKGSRRDSDFVSLFAAHPRLERAVFGAD